MILVSPAFANHQFHAPAVYSGKREFPFAKPSCSNKNNSGNGESDFSTVSPNCGDTITVNTRLTQDLNCPNTTGFALKVVGNGITLDGGRFHINSPLASAGIYVQGNSNTIKNVKVNGTQAYGIFAYDSPGIQITGSDTSSNQTGIEIYAENTVMNNVMIYGNISRSNAVFGIRVSQDGQGSVLSPQIDSNDFSQSGSYAMYIQATKFELSGFSFNSFYQSLNGVYLQDGTFTIHDLLMSCQQIQNHEISVDSAQSVVVKDVELSTQLPPEPSQEHTGLDLYKCKTFEIKNMISSNQDVSVKLETEGGVCTSGTFDRVHFLDDTTAGIMVVSYDTTEYGVLTLADTCGGGESQEVGTILIEPGTLLGPGSNL